eukprot:gene1101-biopygen29188
MGLLPCVWGNHTQPRYIPSALDTLWLVSTTRQRKSGGFYRVVADRDVNGMPVWKCGENWLYSDTSGQWRVTSDEKNIARSFGVITCPSHGGLMPDAVSGWESYVDGKWQEDAGISVTNGRDSGAAAA